MKLDREHKERQLGMHIPGFVGYGTVHYRETDLLLRRFVASKIAEVRDRLADFIVAGGSAGEVREKLALALKTTAFLREEISPAPDGAPQVAEVAPTDEERMLDFDLLLIERVAALHSHLDRLEAAASPEELLGAVELFDEGVAEVDDLFRERRQIMEGAR